MSGALEAAAGIGVVVITAGLGLAAWRILRGPTRADRIIALDLFSVLVVALAALLTVRSGETAFLDVALAYALVAFLGTVAFARYLERSSPAAPDPPQPPPAGDRHE